MTGAEIVEEMVGILISGLQSMATGIAGGVNTFAQALAISGTGETATLSVYFVLVLCFGAVALAASLTTRVFAWLTSLSN